MLDFNFEKKYAKKLFSHPKTRQKQGELSTALIAD